MEEMKTCDVAIVGLGPTGAMLANLLGQGGYSVVGLEREPDLYYSPRAVHFDDEIMRVFQAAGLSEQIGATSEPFTEMEFLLQAGASPSLRMKIGSQDFRYGHHGAWWFHQPTLERHFHDGLKRFGKVAPVYGVEVTGISQDTDGATVRYRTRGGASGELRARYVIGCDGGRSFVRKEAGLPLDSADFDEAWVVVDTKTVSGAKHPDLPKNHRQVCDPRQPVTYVPLAGPYYEWQFMVTGGKNEREATDPAFVRGQMRQFVDLKTIEITRIAYYKFHALWARKWRNGRIILAGDSAHQMPPFLGQGMCSGIRDAISLSWRLDLVLRGAAGQNLLDDYERERSAHVQHIIKGAMFLGHVIQTRNPLVAVLRNWLMFKPANLIPAFNRLIYAIANRKRPLREGFLGSVNRKLAGQMARQPMVVLPGGRSALLDEALGSGFALLARRGAVDIRNPHLARLKSLVDLRVVQFADLADTACIGDGEGQLRRWFDDAAVDFVLIRPDRYVFDAGRASAIGPVAVDFLARFPVPAASAAQWKAAA
jgi:3-(3-hydroxy-phenyl)propionate hydroxylase